MKESKVYVISADDEFDFPSTKKQENGEELIMDYAESKGNVYSLEGFERAFNADIIDSSVNYIFISEK